MLFLRNFRGFVGVTDIDGDEAKLAPP